ncbi:unnamed protein product, partial [Durusdinium trenchii]
LGIVVIYRARFHGHGQVRLRECPVIGRSQNDDFVHYKDVIAGYKNIFFVAAGRGLMVESYILRNAGTIVAKMDCENTMERDMAVKR